MKGWYGMLQGFKEFISKGNAIDLAVGVIIGAAFATIVSSLTTDIITPLIGMFGGQPDFSAITAGPLALGKFLNAVINFLITAAGLYLLIIVPMNAFKKKEETAPAQPPAQEVLLREIRDLLKAR
jgi:large conductance mechanosensitive channel